MSIHAELTPFAPDGLLLAFLNLGNLNGWEVPLIIFVILLMFGGKKLPELARGAARALREFKKVSSEAEDTFRTAMAEDEKQKSEEGLPEVKPAALREKAPVAPSAPVPPENKVS